MAGRQSGVAADATPPPVQCAELLVRDSAAAGAAGGGAAAHACVVGASWSGALLCVSVIVKSGVQLSCLQSGDVQYTYFGTPLDQLAEWDAAVVPASSSAPPAPPPAMLHYLFVSPWSGAVLRAVVAGPAPPLEAASGFPSWAVAGPAGPEPPGASSAAAALAPAGSSARSARGVVALLGDGWPGSGAPAVAASAARKPAEPQAAATNPPPWGTAAMLRHPAPESELAVGSASSIAAMRQAMKGGSAAAGAGSDDGGRRASRARSFAALPLFSNAKPDAFAAGGAARARKATFAVTEAPAADRRWSADSGDDTPSLGAGGNGLGAPDEPDNSRGGVDVDDGGASIDEWDAEDGGGIADGAVVVVAVEQEQAAAAPAADDDEDAPVAPVRPLRAVGRFVQGSGEALSAAHSPLLAVEFTAYPTGLCGSPNFPYILATQADGVVVYSARTGGVVQVIPGLRHAVGLAVCPEEQLIRHNFAAGWLPVGADTDTDELGPEQCALLAAAAARMRTVIASRERVLVFTGTTLVQLTMSPVLMVRGARKGPFAGPLYGASALAHASCCCPPLHPLQQVAELVSLREGQEPPFEDALALCEHVRRVNAQLDLLLEHARRLRPAAQTPRRLSGSADAGGGGGGDEEGEAQAGTYVALGGVSEAKVRSIRSQFGYQLFAKGDFSRGLFHLLEAQEPPASVLALFPQLLPDGSWQRA